MMNNTETTTATANDCMTKVATKFERDGLPTAVMDATETAAYLAVTKDTVYALVRRGELPHTRIGRSIRFRVEDLDAYLEEQTSRTWEAYEADAHRSRENPIGLERVNTGRSQSSPDSTARSTTSPDPSANDQSSSGP